MEANVRIVSVLLPLRNEVLSLDGLIESIKRQYRPDMVELEYLLIDGASDDGSADILRFWEALDMESNAVRLRLLHNQRKSVSPALNLGIREARGDVIIRWDAHTEYAPDYIAKCLRVLDATGAWNVGGPARTKAEGYMQRAVAAAYHSPFSVGGARFHDENYEGFVDTVTYGCWRKQTLIDLGGFDEELVRNQDDELNLHIIRAGGTIYQSPEIRSWYKPRKKLTDLFRQYLQYGYWKVRVIRKHRIPASARHLVPVVFVSGLLLGPILGMIFPVLLSVYVVCLMLYAVLLLSFSAVAARRQGWDLPPVLPIVFMTYHISYGLGFLAGLLDWLFHGKARMSSVFTGLSR